MIYIAASYNTVLAVWKIAEKNQIPQKASCVNTSGIHFAQEYPGACPLDFWLDVNVCDSAF